MSSQCQVISHLHVMTYLFDSQKHQIHDNMDQIHDDIYFTV